MDDNKELLEYHYACKFYAFIRNDRRHYWITHKSLNIMCYVIKLSTSEHEYGIIWLFQ